MHPDVDLQLGVHDSASDSPSDGWGSDGWGSDGSGSHGGSRGSRGDGFASASDGEDALLLSDQYSETHLASAVRAAHAAAPGGAADGDRRPRRGAAHFLVAVSAVVLMLLAVVSFRSVLQPATGDGDGNGEVMKSPNDNREYAAVTLPNGLQALLVSDATADMAGAAMDVMVGSTADPPQFLGLAHLLEHMLFLGTAKYPDENAYNAFLAAHAGSSNAYTSVEHTNYYFEVDAAHLGGALDRFAQFFVAPSLNPGALNREMHAVASEHAKNLQSDAWRQLQLLKHVSSPATSFHQFSTGDLHTLNRTGLHDALVAFHGAYYTAPRMRLCVLGREPLSELRQRVVQLFDGVRASAVPTPALPDDPPSPDVRAVFPPATLRRVISMTPVEDAHVVSLLFPLPSQYYAVRTAPVNAIASLLGDESPGSLSQYVKAADMADTVSVGIEVDSSGMALLAVSLTVIPSFADTMGGPGAVDGGLHTLLHAVFAYINAMVASSAPSAAFWAELRDAAQLHYHFPTKQGTASTVSELAQRLQAAAPELALRPPSTWQWDGAAVDDLMGLLTPQNVLVMDMSSRFAAYASELGEEEPVYGTAFASSKLSDAQVAALSNAALPGAGFHPPRRNPYLPKLAELQVLPPPTADPRVGGDVAPPATRPVVVDGGTASDAHTVWWLQDTEFQRPFVDVRLQLDVSVQPTPRNAVLMALYVQAVKDHLQLEAYEAARAGFAFSLSSSARPAVLSLALTGYSSGMHAWLAAVVNGTAHPALHVDRFEATRALVLQDLANQNQDQSYKIALRTMHLMMRLSTAAVGDMLDAAEVVSFDDLKDFAAVVLTAWRAQLLVHGNADVRTAHAMWATVRAVLPPQGGGAAPPPLSVDAVAAAQLHITNLTAPTNGAQPVTVQHTVPNPDNTNHAVLRLMQAGLQDRCVAGSASGGAVARPAATLVEPPAACVRRTTLFKLLRTLMQEPAFNVLRTQEQLGYIVGAYPFDMATWMGPPGALLPTPTDASDPAAPYAVGGMDVALGVMLLAQGDAKGAAAMDARVVAFMQSFRRTLEGLSVDEWNAGVAAVLTDVERRPLSLADRTTRVWRPISARSFWFTRLDREAAVLRSLRANNATLPPLRNEVLRVYDDAAARTVAVEVFGGGVEPPFPAPPAGNVPMATAEEFKTAWEGVFS